MKQKSCQCLRFEDFLLLPHGFRSGSWACQSPIGLQQQLEAIHHVISNVFVVHVCRSCSLFPLPLNPNQRILLGFLNQFDDCCHKNCDCPAVQWTLWVCKCSQGSYGCWGVGRNPTPQPVPKRRWWSELACQSFRNDCLNNLSLSWLTSSPVVWLCLSELSHSHVLNTVCQKTSANGYFWHASCLSHGSENSQMTVFRW